MTISSTSHESMWAERVRSWKSSGETATEFARQGGFTPSALRYWATRLGRASRATVGPAMVRLVSKSSEVTTSPSAELVVEIGVARIRVPRGFDVEVFTVVARALGGGGA